MGCSSLGVRVGVERGWRGVESLGGCCGAVVLWCTGVKEARSNARCAWSEGPPSLPRWREARGRGAVLALAGPSRPHGRAAWQGRLCTVLCALVLKNLLHLLARVLPGGGVAARHHVRCHNRLQLHVQSIPGGHHVVVVYALEERLDLYRGEVTVRRGRGRSTCTARTCIRWTSSPTTSWHSSS